jgi:hypothetical protein
MSSRPNTLQVHSLVKTDYTNYYLTIETTYLLNTSIPFIHKLILCDTKRSCVELSIERDDYRPNGNIFCDPSTANMNYIYYSHKYNINGKDLKYLMNTVMSIAIKYFPWINKINIIDGSATRVLGNGKEISLSRCFIALYGKTWYEMLFKATTEDEKYSERLKRFTDPTYKMDYWYVVNRFRMTHIPEIQKIYDKADTNRIFFTKLDKHFKDTDDLLEFIQPWIGNYIDYIMGSNKNYLFNPWIIHKNNIEFIEIKKDNIIPLKGNCQLYLKGESKFLKEMV